LGNGIGIGSTDWNHLNSIDYNAELDQIMLSSREFNEIWIIDHSTTTEEAAGHTGGNSGKGGDLLYRWGNPQLYGQGTEADQTLFGQHDAHWVAADRPDAGKILLFNNGLGRPEGNFSTIDLLEPPINGGGQYLKEPGIAFGPTTLAWQYQANPPTSFYEQRVSGAQQQPNGNMLICAGRGGQFFEVTPVGKTVWEYINPVSIFGITAQGTVNNGGGTFRVYRYAPDYPALIDKSLEPMGPIELNPLPSDCKLSIDPTTSTQTVAAAAYFKVFPNPVEAALFVENPDQHTLTVRLLDVRGQLLLKRQSNAAQVVLAAQDWPSGLYLLQILDQQTQGFFTQKIIR
ncbi:MAG: aryl-sulfate sulfotransferase, partial [Bacteroidota bacterium]